MEKKYFHLSNQELLLAADGELSSRRAAQVQAHLAACWECRARMAEVETTIADFVRASCRDADSKLPPVAGSRALLRAQLSELNAVCRPSRWHQLRLAVSAHALSFAFALALLVTLGAGIVYQRTARRESDEPRSAFAVPLPNPNLTPGSTRPVVFAQLCSEEHDDVVRDVPDRLRQEVFQRYGMAGARAADYEVDYLITPGLGGSDDVRNLWPEPHRNTVWNSYVKDQLEDRLHHLVCSRQLDLAEAQQEMAGDWISAYKKYFHTDAPLPQIAMIGVQVKPDTHNN